MGPDASEPSQIHNSPSADQIMQLLRKGESQITFAENLHSNDKGQRLTFAGAYISKKAE